MKWLVSVAAANVLDSMAWSVKITEKVNAIAETPVPLWSALMPPDLGRLTWSTAVEDLATITTMQDKLLADPGYVEHHRRSFLGPSPDGRPPGRRAR
jgi:hypothetical protein